MITRNIVVIFFILSPFGRDMKKCFSQTASFLISGKNRNEKTKKQKTEKKNIKKTKPMVKLA
jgi:hypothetical protein